MFKFLFLVIAVVCLPFLIHCQDDSLQRHHSSVHMDARDWLLQRRWSGKRDEKKGFLFVLPVIGANPAAGFIYGGGLSYTYRNAKPGNKFSTFSSNASYSTKRLANLNLKSNLFLLKDRLLLNGDWRYFVISETTYGLGSVTGPKGDVLRYNHIRFHETASWKLFSDLFAGMGFVYDHFSNIRNITPDSGALNDSYNDKYSLSHGFSPAEYLISGFTLNLLFDNRDNQVNAQSGFYANLNYRINEIALGSQKYSTLLLAEYRAYFALNKYKKENVLAFWIYGDFLIHGDAPYLLLPALGYDQRQKSGRGYAFGRFRGENIVYAESEYRFPISVRTGILGAVVFMNVTSTSDKTNHIRLFDYDQPAFGGGIRILLDKISRTRLAFDAAIGRNKIGLYFGIREAF